MTAIDAGSESTAHSVAEKIFVSGGRTEVILAWYDSGKWNGLRVTTEAQVLDRELPMKERKTPGVSLEYIQVLPRDSEQPGTP